MKRFLALFAAIAAIAFSPAALAQTSGFRVMPAPPIPLVGSCGTVTVSTPCLDLTQAWNAGAVTFTGLKLNVTDTASTGGSLLADLQVGGVSQFSVSKAAVLNLGGSNSGQLLINSTTPEPRFYFNANANRMSLGSAGQISWGNTTSASSTQDLFLLRDTANVLALRNGTNAQTFNVYNTYTDASNNEALRFLWNSATAYIGTTQSGTGVARSLAFQMGGTTIFNIATSGHILFNTDNTTDIGALAANRPRNVYIAGALSVGGNITGTTASALYIGGSTRGAITQASDGAYTFANNAGTLSTTLTPGTSNSAVFNGTIESASGSIYSAAGAGVYVKGKSGFASATDGTFRITNNAGTLTTDITLSGASSTGTSLATFGGGLSASASITSGGVVSAGAAQFLRFTSRTLLSAPVDGNLLLQDSAAATFGLLQFGGTASTFPALKRNATVLEVRTADDANYGTFRTSTHIFAQGSLLNDIADGTFQFRNGAGTNSITMAISGGAGGLAAITGSLSTSGNLSVGSASQFTWGGPGQSRIAQDGDGLIRLTNGAATGFTRLILGTNDTSGISIKKNGTAFNFRLGDDSADAVLNTGAITSSTSVAATTYIKTGTTTVAGLPAAATVGAGARYFVTDSTAGAGSFGATVAGGGSSKVPVTSDGTNWIIGANEDRRPANDNTAPLYNLAA